MAKKYYCQCLDQKTGKRIRCMLESNLNVKFRACPYDRGFANWVEWKRSMLKIIRGTVIRYAKTKK
jgi:hypothetical protein